MYLSRSWHNLPEMIMGTPSYVAVVSIEIRHKNAPRTLASLFADAVARRSGPTPRDEQTFPNKILDRLRALRHPSGSNDDRPASRRIITVNLCNIHLVNEVENDGNLAVVTTNAGGHVVLQQPNPLSLLVNFPTLYQYAASLRRLVIDGWLGTDAFTGVPEALPLLEHLDVAGCVASSLEPLQQCRHLRRVIVRTCGNISALCAPPSLTPITAAGGSSLHMFDDDGGEAPFFPVLEELDASYTSVGSLAPLRYCRQLRRLHVTGCERLQSIDGLAESRHLCELSAGGTAIRSLLPLQKHCTQLEVLALNHCRQLTSLEGLGGKAALRTLRASWVRVTSLEPLQACTHLHTLDLSGSLITSLQELRALRHLAVVSLAGTRIRDLAPLQSSHRTLATLELHDCQHLTALDSLLSATTTVANIFCRIQDDNQPKVATHASPSDMERNASSETAAATPAAHDPVIFSALTVLNISGTDVSTLAPLTAEQCPDLRVLRCRGCHQIDSVAPLAPLRGLEIVEISGTAITSLAPLTQRTAAAASVGGNVGGSGDKACVDSSSCITEPINCHACTPAPPQAGRRSVVVCVLPRLRALDVSHCEGLTSAAGLDTLDPPLAEFDTAFSGIRRR